MYVHSFHVSTCVPWISWIFNSPKKVCTLLLYVKYLAYEVWGGGWFNEQNTHRICGTKRNTHNKIPNPNQPDTLRIYMQTPKWWCVNCMRINCVMVSYIIPYIISYEAVYMYNNPQIISQMYDIPWELSQHIKMENELFRDMPKE